MQMADAEQAEEEKLVKALQEGLISLWREESAQHHRDEGSYYPSSIGSCIRKQYYTYTVEEKPNPERLAVFATGKGIHAAVAEALSKSGIVSVDAEEYPVELFINNEVKLRGRVDVLLVQLDGTKSVVEVKSTSRIPDQPYDSHYLQLQTYLHALGLERGFLLYWDKRTGAVKAYSAQKDPNALRRIGERAIILHEHLKSGRPPFKEAVVENRYWECDLCDFYGICNPFLVSGMAMGSSIAVFDIDGTVFDDSGRIKAVMVSLNLPPATKPEDLRGSLRDEFSRAYFEGALLNQDKPNSRTLELIWKQKKAGKHVVLLSERPTTIKEQTEKQLREYGIPFDALLLRPSEIGAFGWKRDMVKRLKDNYVISIFVDDSSFVRDDVAKLGVKAVEPPSPA